MIGRGVTAAAADAAFVNAVTSHTTLQEDVGGGAHPGTYVFLYLSRLASSIDVRAKRSWRDRCRLRSGATNDLAAGTGLEKAAIRTISTVGVFGAAASAAVCRVLILAKLRQRSTSLPI